MFQEAWEFEMMERLCEGAEIMNVTEIGCKFNDI